jgi:hypothetical protein
VVAQLAGSEEGLSSVSKYTLHPVNLPHSTAEMCSTNEKSCSTGCGSHYTFRGSTAVICLVVCIPDRSEENVPWILSSPLSETRIIV